MSSSNIENDDDIDENDKNVGKNDENDSKNDGNKTMPPSNMKYICRFYGHYLTN